MLRSHNWPLRITSHQTWSYCSAPNLEMSLSTPGPLYHQYLAPSWTPSPLHWCHLQVTLILAPRFFPVCHSSVPVQSQAGPCFSRLGLRPWPPPGLMPPALYCYSIPCRTAKEIFLEPESGMPPSSFSSCPIALRRAHSAQALLGLPDPLCSPCFPTRSASD